MTLTRGIFCGCALFFASCAAQMEGDESYDSPEVATSTEALIFGEQCTAEQRSVLTTYRGWLYEYINDAVFKFQVPVTGQRRDFWFGQLDLEQAQFVTSNLYYMLDSVIYNNRRYDCNEAHQPPCENGWDAGTSIGWLYAPIAVCPPFWEHGNQTRLEALAHETAHHAGAEDLPGIAANCDAARDIVLGNTDYHPSSALAFAHNYACYVMNPWNIPD